MKGVYPKNLGKSPRILGLNLQRFFVFTVLCGGIPFLGGDYLLFYFLGLYGLFYLFQHLIPEGYFFFKWKSWNRQNVYKGKQDVLRIFR